MTLGTTDGMGDENSGEWPFTKESDWCGEHPEMSKWGQERNKNSQSVAPHLGVRARKFLFRMFADGKATCGEIISSPETAKKLAQIPITEWMKIKHCGLTTVSELRRWLKYHGLEAVE